MSDPKKNKYQEKPKPPVYYNFDFDPEQITIKTVIPELPEKSKPKPDEKIYNKKIKELQEKLDKLKKERKHKKAQYNKLGVGFQEESSKLQQNIQLGNKCIKVLEVDLSNIEDNIEDLQSKIDRKKGYIRKLQRDTKNKNVPKKDYDQMTYEELDLAIAKIQVRISTANLNKKQETELNSLVGKLKRLQMKASHGEAPENKEQEIAQTEQTIEKLKKIKTKEENQLATIKYKIECIQQDVRNFGEELEELQEKKKNPELEDLKQSANDMKQKIYEIRQEIAEVKQNFLDKQYEYDYQQKKIQWIKFATKTKDERLAEWEAEKAQRKKKRQYEQNKNKDGKQQNSAKDEKGFPEKPKINKNQKQIDACTFLINYCQGLYPQNSHKEQNALQNKAGNIDLSKALKKGEWAKEKGVEVVISKKAQEDEAPVKEGKNKRKNKKANAVPQKAEQEKQKKIVHTIFIQNIFDSLKTIPPTTVEDIEKTIDEIKDKLDYYLIHPDFPSSYDEKEAPKRSYNTEKYKKAQNKKIINTEDFPSLS